MFKFVCSLFLGLVFCATINGQIIVPLSTLPDVGDQLLYQSIPPDTIVVKVDNQVFQTGANLQWDFSTLATGEETMENYTAVTSGTVADSFPNADIIVDFIGVKGYAIRNTTDISIIGIAGDSISGLTLPIIGLLDKPFTIRRAPFGFGDQFATNTSYSLSLDAQGLDSIPEIRDLAGQIPGATIDSLRVTLSIDRSENVDGWGMISIPSGDVPVLKMTQSDIASTTIEVYAVTIVGSAWIDLSPFLPEGTSELLQTNTTNHIFYGAEDKEAIAEFSMAPDSTLLSARYARDITSGFFNNDRFNNLIDVSLYPNPTSDWVNVEIENELLKDNLMIKLFDASGQLIKTQVITQSISQLNLSNFNSGIHLLSIHSNQELLYRNLIMVTE